MLLRIIDLVAASSVIVVASTWVVNLHNRVDYIEERQKTESVVVVEKLQETPTGLPHTLKVKQIAHNQPHTIQDNEVEDDISANFSLSTKRGLY